MFIYHTNIAHPSKLMLGVFDGHGLDGHKVRGRAEVEGSQERRGK
jgi:hypothetical protein